MGPIYHNGSRAIITRDKGLVEVKYETPRPSLSVKPGTLLFSGTWDGRGNYQGAAYTFKRGCDPAPYPVTGREGGPGIIMSGVAPHRDAQGCSFIGATANSKHSRLVFEYEMEQGD